MHATRILDPVFAGAEYLDQLSNRRQRVDSERSRISNGRSTRQIGIDAVRLHRGDGLGAYGLYRAQQRFAPFGGDSAGNQRTHALVPLAAIRTGGGLPKRD